MINEPSAPFKRMQERITLNQDAAFGGAVVIVPPEGGGDPVELLLFTEQPAAAFWAFLKALVDVKITAMDQASSPQYGGFPRR